MVVDETLVVLDTRVVDTAEETLVVVLETLVPDVLTLVVVLDILLDVPTLVVVIALEARVVLEATLDVVDDTRVVLVDPASLTPTQYEYPGQKLVVHSEDTSGFQRMKFACVILYFCSIFQQPSLVTTRCQLLQVFTEFG